MDLGREIANTLDQNALLLTAQTHRGGDTPSPACARFRVVRAARVFDNRVQVRFQLFPAALQDTRERGVLFVAPVFRRRALVGARDRALFPTWRRRRRGRGVCWTWAFFSGRVELPTRVGAHFGVATPRAVLVGWLVTLNVYFPLTTG